LALSVLALLTSLSISANLLCRENRQCKLVVTSVHDLACMLRCRAKQ